MSTWQTLDTVPVTATTDRPFGVIPALLYSHMVGVQIGSLYRNGQSPQDVSASIAHLAGEAIEHWGVTHWMPLPDAPVT